MHGLHETALLAGPSILDQRAISGGAHDWNWRQIHTAAAQLAATLDAGGTVCNLCHTRAGFLVTWLACARRGCMQVLPPSSGQADLIAILDAAPAPTIVVDDAALLQPAWASHARCLVWAYQPAAASKSTPHLAWAPDWDAPALSLYTSGSTGAPEQQVKTLGQLVRGAQILATRLDEHLGAGNKALAAVDTIVCSVPQQHMFGLESSVMLPLVRGIAVMERRPLLPLDVRAAMEGAGGMAMWVATPLHLRALAQARQALPHCAAALVSTMPLAPALAAQVEALIEAPVIEIYGSTETGVMATRRTAHAGPWQPADEVHFEIAAPRTLVSGSHFSSPRQLADEFSFDASGCFELLGRQADLLKIAGRRASLAHLNLVLQDLPGLDDGVFYLPASGSPTARLVLIYAGAPLDRAHTLRWLRERMDPIFLPRSLIRVERLPRADNGKLARAALDALYDAHVPAAPPATATIAFDFQVGATHPSLTGHFPGRPVVPGVLLLDHVMEGVRAHGGMDITALQKVKFLSPLLPGEIAQVRCELGAGRVSFRVSAVRDGGLIALTQGTASTRPSCAMQVRA
jgi:acyl-coenzyme A synthetase/AMP-(fatty) acid ligase